MSVLRATVPDISSKKDLVQWGGIFSLFVWGFCSSKTEKNIYKTTLTTSHNAFREKKTKKNPIPIKEHIFPWIFFLGIWKVFVCLFLFDQLTCQRVGWKLISNTIRRKQLKSFRQRAEIWWITKICKWNKNSGEGGGERGRKKREYGGLRWRCFW